MSRALTLVLFCITAGIQLFIIDALNKAVDRLSDERDRVQVLFRELQHRVANNLAFIASLLRLQRRIWARMHDRKVGLERENRTRQREDDDRGGEKEDSRDEASPRPGEQAIEQQLNYPGEIKVTVVRETRSVEFAR